MAEEQPDAATPEEEIDAQPSASEPATPSTPIQTQAPAAPTPAPAPAQAPQPMAQPQAQAPDHGNIFKSILGVLGGGDKTQYSVDPQTGTMSVSRVPQTKGQLARGILAGALTGLVAGAGEHGPGNEGKAFQAGAQAATQQRQQADAQQRQLAQQNYDQQQKAIVQKAQVFEANSRAALNTQQAEKLGDERMDSYIDYMKPMVTAAAAEGRVIAGQDQPITQQEALDGMKSGKYNPAEVMWTPTARAPRVGADGKDNGSELVGVLVKDGMMDLRKPEVNKGNAVKYGFIPENATQMKTSMYNQIMQKTQMVDNAKDEMTKVHQQLGTAADGMPDFDSIIKTPGMADALQKFQGYVGAAKGFDPANAINAMSQEKMNPKTGQPVSNPDAKYVPLIYKAFGGQDVIKQYETKVNDETVAAKLTADTTAKANAEAATPLGKAKLQSERLTVANKSLENQKLKHEVDQFKTDAGDVSLQGPDYLKTLPPDQQALYNEIGTGKMALNRLEYIAARKPELLEGVARAFPDFDSSKVKSYFDTYKDFTSGPTSKALNSGGTGLLHLKELLDLNTVASHIPHTPAWTAYQNKADTVSAELAKFYGDATIPAIAAIKSTLASTLPGNRESAIKTQAKSMGDKLDAYEQQWKNAAPSAAYQAPLPNVMKASLQARAALDPDYARRMQGGGPPQGAAFQGKGSDGKMYWLGANKQVLGPVQ